MSSAKRPQRRGVHPQGRSISEGPAGRENLPREEGRRKADGFAVTDKGGTKVERFALARGNFPGRPVERTGAGFYAIKDMQGMVTAAMNGSATETAGYPCPAFHRWNDGFAGSFTRSQSRQSNRLLRSRSNREMPDAPMPMGTVEPARIAIPPRAQWLAKLNPRARFRSRCTCPKHAGRRDQMAGLKKGNYPASGFCLRKPSMKPAGSGSNRSLQAVVETDAVQVMANPLSLKRAVLPRQMGPVLQWPAPAWVWRLRTRSFNAIGDASLLPTRQTAALFKRSKCRPHRMGTNYDDDHPRPARQWRFRVRSHLAQSEARGGVKALRAWNRSLV